MECVFPCASSRGKLWDRRLRWVFAIHILSISSLSPEPAGSIINNGCGAGLPVTHQTPAISAVLSLVLTKLKKIVRFLLVHRNQCPPIPRLHGHRKHPSHLARLRAWARWRPVEGQTLRIVLGHFICFSCFLAPWHVLPVFLDLKIAADPNLPGLTEKNLPITTTAIFLGWLVGSVCLKRLMEAFNKEQLVAGCACGLVLVTLATVTLLDLTAGNLVIFTSIRFVYGILLNITGIQIVHIQELMPGRENQA